MINSAKMVHPCKPHLTNELLLSVVVIAWLNVATVANLGLNIGCDDGFFNCQCGSAPNYKISIRVKQCTYFYRWKHYCKPCDDLKEEAVCANYLKCQECSEDAKRCISCPPAKYGLWCSGECACQNGGKCNQEDGSCQCPSNFKGKNCEIKDVVTCSPPQIGEKISWANTLYQLGALAIGHCAANYVMVRNSTLVCHQDGAWSGMPPLCDPVCTYPNLGPNIRATTNPGLASKILDVHGHEVIRELLFECESGYAMVGPQRIRCLPSLSWDQEPAQCKPKISCADPGIPPNGTRTISDAFLDGSFVPGTQILFQCDGSFFLKGSETLTCTVKGEWSSSLPECVPITGCPPPNAPKNGHVVVTKSVPSARSALRIVSRIGVRVTPKVETRKPSSDEVPPGYSTVNSRGLYSCRSTFYALRGTNTRMCMKNGQWSGREPSCEPICGRASAGKRPTVINGEPSEVGRWPWQVAISFLEADTWQIGCGGSLLSESWVVTAAHCLTYTKPLQVKEKEILKIYLGKYFANDSMDDSEVQTRSVASIVVHPNYHPKSIDSDIALIKLSEPIVFDSRIQPVCLPKPTQSPLEEGTVGTISAWGRTETGMPAEQLLEAPMPVVNRTTCETDYSRTGLHVTITNNMFCAGYQEGGIGICKGDSGGPFVVERPGSSGSEGSWFLEGIVSWGSGCAVKGRYGGFIRVANFWDFINEYI